MASFQKQLDVQQAKSKGTPTSDLILDIIYNICAIIELESSSSQSTFLSSGSYFKSIIPCKVDPL